ncbi:hypothetical protein Goarm_010134, partial [Gossypium armourianum]|nr:hypothetical protein [Gossypium armourianum]
DFNLEVIETGETLFVGGGIGRSTKKVRRRLAKPPDPNNPILDAKGMTVNSSGIPFITFSERVHQFITYWMSRTIIVKLLGRRISYLTMSSKLQTIWKTKHPLKILDLENDYFSIKS